MENHVANLDVIRAMSSYAKALADNAISQRAHRYEQLADVSGQRRRQRRRPAEGQSSQNLRAAPPMTCRRPPR